MSLLWQRLIMVLTCLGLVSACFEERDENNDFAVYLMSEVQLGMQSFQPNDLPYDKVDADKEYLYRNKITDESSEITFYQTNGSEIEVVELEITAINDLNNNYSALSIDDITVQSGGVNYRDDYVVIQNKANGNIYAIEDEDGKLLLSKDLNENLYWYNTFNYANLADHDRIYLNDSENNELIIFELQGSVFKWIDSFDYDGYTFWVNKSGDILTQRESNKSRMSLQDRSSSVTFDENFDSSSYLPFLYQGKFYSAARSSNNTIYEMNVTTTNFSWQIDDGWTNNDSYKPSIDAARNGDYEMATNCELYLFDNSDPDNIEISYIDDFKADEGQLAVAGQDALFCVYNSSGSSAPNIVNFDTATGYYSTYKDLEGDISDAIANFTVISDQLVMFSKQESDSVEEYYVDFYETKNKSYTVKEASVTSLQRLEE